MKLRALCLSCLAFASFCAAQEPASSGWARGRGLEWNPTAMATNPALKYHALLIGITDYQTPLSGRGWDDLGTAVQDVQALGDVLKSKFDFDVTILSDKQATRARILSALDFVLHLDINDAALVYFAGHGLFDENMGEGFWIPADARQPDGQTMPREDWIWNSAVEKIVGGSKARHVLVISDSCYAGSLFRGEADRSGSPDLQWYIRANAKPSRYLITSGDYEPVADGDGKHSLFAQSLLDFLGADDRSVFSASDMGMAVRQKVSAQTGQMVRMGSMGLSSDAGGEMVFISKELLDSTGEP